MHLSNENLPWAKPHLHMRIFCWIALAGAWFALGLNSNSVPWGTDWFWIVACGSVAGAALGYLTRRTVPSLLVYLGLATAVGLVRSVAYLSNDSGGPAAVWLVIGLTNLLIYVNATQTGWGPRAE